MLKRLMDVLEVFGMITLIVTLMSCSHRYRQDGPPTFYVDETRIPNAVPRNEPLAKYGNMTSYVVKGKRYYTMKSYNNYDEVGVASWYGTRFHSQRPSSGEPYDMLAMTAAHKYLPLPTYVEVTNLKNKKSIIVKVNDRGPFKPNRIIDLSYVAAKKLGMLLHGTAPVRVRAINPFNFGQRLRFAKFDAPNPMFRKQLYLQVGAFKNKYLALRLKERLANVVRSPISIIRPNVHTMLYRVRIGPIKDLGTANFLTQRLQGLGINVNRAYGA